MHLQPDEHARSADDATVSHDMNRLFVAGNEPVTLTLVGPTAPIVLGAPVYQRGIYEIVFASSATVVRRLNVAWV